MNFFQHQDDARRSTRQLVLLFGLAVIALVLLTNLLVFGLVFYFDPDKINSLTARDAWSRNFDWALFLEVGAVVAVVILLGSAYKIVALAGGGARVAEMLGGQLLVDGGSDLDRQRLLNVVAEMAIASGTPVPPVYLLDEDGINAFAAGYTPGDAVIGVTRGAVEKLSRDELQGVIAHEFSHILNGDMRLNIRLIGVLHGILLIGLIGHHVLRGTRHSARSRNAGGVALVGLGLMIIGYAGTFFGKLIKAGVSRQREYLADASAVQYTRNPSGIAGALKRIGASSKGSIIDHPDGEQISHALFGQGMQSFTGLFATHPPLEQRIRRIEPDWDGRFEQPAAEPAAEASTASAPGSAEPDRAASLAAMAAVIAAGDMIERVGQPTRESIERAQALIRSLPEALREASKSPYSARAVIYVLVIDTRAALQQEQLRYLQANGDRGIHEETRKLLAEQKNLPVELRLPLVDLCLSSLHQLSPAQYQRFQNNLNVLVEMDSRISLFEWSIRKILFHHLDPVFHPEAMHKRKLLDLKHTADACSVLLSMLFHAGRPEQADSGEIEHRIASELGIDGVDILPASVLTLAGLNDAMDTLSRLKPLQKPRLLKTCVKIVTADDEVTARETELLRAVSAVIDCPIPPLPA